MSAVRRRIAVVECMKPMRNALFVKLAFFLTTSLLSGQTYDLLIKGGHVIDPSNRIDGVMDVAIRGGRIARVAADIPAAGGRKVIDAAGLYVTPGLIDLHSHVFGYDGSLFPDDTSLVP